MIAVEEQAWERFPDNHSGNRQSHNDRNNQSGQQNRKRRPDNTVASVDKSKRYGKPKKFEDLEDIPCTCHPNGSHTAGDCRVFKYQGYARKNDQGKGKKDDPKDKEDQGDKGFQRPKGTVAIFFAGIPSSKSKWQDKLALSEILAVEPATPKYLN